MWPQVYTLHAALWPYPQLHLSHLFSQQGGGSGEGYGWGHRRVGFSDKKLFSHKTVVSKLCPLNGNSSRLICLTPKLNQRISGYLKTAIPG